MKTCEWSIVTYFGYRNSYFYSDLVALYTMTEQIKDQGKISFIDKND